MVVLPGINIHASIPEHNKILKFFLGIFLCVYLYRGFVLIGPPSEELGVNVGVRSLHFQRVQPFILIVHRLRERERDGRLVTSSLPLK